MFLNQLWVVKFFLYIFNNSSTLCFACVGYPVDGVFFGVWVCRLWVGGGPGRAHDRGISVFHQSVI
ncbi:hypothetical protein, partial [Enterobacter intestinihominis]